MDCCGVGKVACFASVSVARLSQKVDHLARLLPFGKLIELETGEDGRPEQKEVCR